MPLILFGAFVALASVVVFSRATVQKRLMNGVADLWLRIQALYLPSTRITIDQSQFGHIISVNDDLQLIRHASGRLAYMPVHRQTSQRRPLPRALKALLLTFFTL